MTSTPAAAPLALVDESGLSTDLRALVELAAEVAKDDTAPATRKAYDRQFARFQSWCQTSGLPYLPTEPTVVTTYITALAQSGVKVPTLEQAIAAISHAHREAGLPWDKSPALLQRLRKGFRRRLLVAKTQKTPVEDSHLKAILATCGDDLLGRRDRALLLVGWCGAFRRSEIVFLDVADVTVEEQGLRIVLRKSKTDQEGVGFVKGLCRNDDKTLCVVQALEDWLAASAIKEGALFRILGRGQRLGARLSAASVALVVKSRIREAGYDPKTFSGHSLRAGFATTAQKNGKGLDEIQRQTGHKKTDSIVTYVRHATIFTKNASMGILR